MGRDMDVHNIRPRWYPVGDAELAQGRLAGLKYTMLVSQQNGHAAYYVQLGGASSAGISYDMPSAKRNAWWHVLQIRRETADAP